MKRREIFSCEEALDPPILIEDGLETEIAHQYFYVGNRTIPRTLIWSGTPRVIHNLHRKPKLLALMKGGEC
ncbi:MAG TPA: hypothetical protein DCP69_04350 [Candidatus Omnitrophica bacterium]|nr:hypothetical protein [Candidatus Omnitrophota bacterium]